MSRPHLRFTRFHPKVLRATDDFFGSHPWRGTDDERQTKFERWLARAARAYRIPIPRLEIWERDRDPSGTETTPDSIRLDKLSVISMFHAFRHYMQYCGRVPGREWSNEMDPLQMIDAEDDALAWSTSLFYCARPRLFRKAVRSGRVMGLQPNDLMRATPEEASLN